MTSKSNAFKKDTSLKALSSLVQEKIGFSSLEDDVRKGGRATATPPKGKKVPKGVAVIKSFA